MMTDRDSLIMGIAYTLCQARDAAASDLIKSELDLVIQALQRGGDLDYDMLGLQVNLAANDFLLDIPTMEELHDIGYKIVNQLPLLEKPPEPTEEPGADPAEQETRPVPE